MRGISTFFRSKLPESAEDLTQRTFLALLEAPDRFRGESSLRTYLFAIARKQLLMHLRTLTTERRRFDPATWSLVDVGVAVSRPATARQEQSLLLQAMAGLPVDHRIALELFYWEELEIAAIAEVLEEPIGTVKSRLSRARARLRELLEALAASRELHTSVTVDLDRWLRSLPAAVRRGTEAAD